MRLAPGSRLGSYDVIAQLGVGGMGEVYRARDGKLGREVAVKVLSDSFAQDPERLLRFEREAKVLATLNHSHIAAIYGIEDADLSPGSGQAPIRALVLELVEGPTLAARIAQGPLPLDEALPIARQIAEALEAAHEHGIMHRDLKPSNIKVRPDGAVKVLDFGLAKMREPEGSDAHLSNSPTMMTASVAGTILGTAAYMSPEQAKGKAADRTTDIWAFGCVLYEMLTGHRAFEGDTVAEILAGVLKAEVDWRRLPPDTPEPIRRLLRRCLQKERLRRLHDIADARLEVEDAQNGAHPDRPAGPSSSGRLERLVWLSAVSVLALLLVVAGARAIRPLPSVPERRLDIATPPTTDPASIAIAPNGQELAFAATSEGGRPRLWMRSLGSASARALAGTEEASDPFWSPDGRSLGFFANNQLKRIDIDSGAIRALADARGGIQGGAWNRDGVILYVPTNTSPVFRVSATGGEPVAVTRLNPPQQNGHQLPQFLPDSRHFLYHASGNPQASGIYVGDIDGSDGHRLLDADVKAVYASGHLLFVRQRTLLAQVFDPIGLTLSGNPSPVAEGVLGRALSASDSGLIVYRAGSATGGQRQLAWFDRSGKELGKLGEPDSANPSGLSMSADGRRALMNRAPGGNNDIWSLDTTRGTLSRLTTYPGVDNFPVESPDGSRIAFSSNRKGVYDLYLKRADGSGNEEPLLVSDLNKNLADWSPDGRFVLFRSLDPMTGFDLWALPMDGEGRKPFPVVRTAFDDRDGQFSNDSRWVAYQSNESGRSEIYMQPFPGPGERMQVSTAGGAQVRWRGDGKELFYIALDGRLMAVSVRVIAGQRVEVGAPMPLFTARVGAVVQGARQQYAVTDNGDRFLMNTLVEEAPTPVSVILNWNPK